MQNFRKKSENQKILKKNMWIPFELDDYDQHNEVDDDNDDKCN